MMSGVRALAVLAAAVGTLAVASAAAGADDRVVPLSFTGTSCTAVAGESYRLPAAARLAYARSPVVGAWLGATKADRYPRQATVRVTGVDLQGRTLTVTVAADPARCLGSALPGEPVDASWTAAVDAELSWIVPDERWARRQVKSLVGDLLAPAYADEARIRCRRAGQARFGCSFDSFAGDSIANGRGTVAIGRDDEVARYSFRVQTFDEYCYLVVHRPLRRCLRTMRWRG